MGPSFNKQQTLAVALILGAFLFSILRGVRWPNDWAEAHWLIGYQFGFLRRALLGTLLVPRITPPSDALTVIRTLATLLSVTFWISLIGMGIRISVRNGAAGVAVVLVFATSPYVVLLGHLNGYYDIPILLLSLLAATLVLRDQVWKAAAALSVAVLIHESVIILGLPFVLFLITLKNRINPFSKKTLRLGYPLVVLPLAVFAVLATYQALALDPFPLRKELIKHLAHYPFVQEFRHVIVPEKAFTTSFTTYLETQSPEFWSRITHPFSLNILIPLAFLFLAAVRLLKQSSRGLKQLVFLGGICLLPLSLHMVAWDTERIWAYPLVVAYVGLWSITTIERRESLRSSRMMGWGGIAIAAAQFLSQIPLMDGETDRLGFGIRVVLALALAFFGVVYLRLKQKEPRPLEICREDRPRPGSRE